LNRSFALMIRFAPSENGSGLLIRFPMETIVASGACPSAMRRPHHPSMRFPSSHTVPVAL
jgi:hypothetical protein